ncbi:hypothetical protein QP888_02090 [Corynebacterium sp. MSK297]|uniref:hypothetical protein n=1 Tax=Corynebacterium sp. MSK297 TaxID=3050221 RepID=UPI00254EDE7A|nr:hypothetical protein [Corynebacterium sp. MSK297]MDK8845320.1 hypothetical protein [Corynebacterium sp. MSK297]
MFIDNTSLSLFIDFAQESTDDLISRFNSIGADPSDPWSRNSLCAVAVEFLEGSMVSHQDVTLLIGEGLVRLRGGYWSLQPMGIRRGVEDFIDFYPDLTIQYLLGVTYGQNESATIPSGWVHVLREYREPNLLYDVIHLF